MLFSGALLAETLCKSGETVYFSCKLAHSAKTVSLCGSSLERPQIFWIQYRFGTSSHLELAYPQNQKQGKVLFLKSGIDVGYYRRSNGFDTEVSFTNDGWSYTVFSWEGGEAASSYGVFVARKREGPGTTLNCKETPNFGPNQSFSSFAQIYGQDN